MVSAERLIDAVWGDAPPETARHALQVYVSQLRKALPDGEERIRTEPAGYRIVVEEHELDALRFADLARRGHLMLAENASAAFELLEEAISLWQGPFETDAAADPEAARLEELLLSAHEDRIAAALELGRHAQIVPELERLVAQHPLRERLRHQHMLALYRSGRQADALAVYAATRRMLVEELGLEPGPELRDLEAAILRQDPGLAVPGAGAQSPPQPRLPAAATPLLGRRAEVEEIHELLVGEARLVTVTGPGGAGKTRVALQVARELAGDLADGVVFVGLAALREPELVGAEIAAALEIEAGARAIDEALAEYLRTRAMLLLLDNFEQVDAAAPLLAELLRAAPGLKLLVTSRLTLRIYGEYEYALPPLRLTEEAIPLFVARARAAGAAVAPDEDVARVCEALDRLPLAIELAAARARSLSPAEMLAPLRSRLELASEGPRDAPDRHRALEATIAWSHDLLDERLRAVFAALAVFAGGCDAEAAHIVADAGPADLAALRTHSLVREDSGRFAMLETIREFAAAQLERSGRSGVVHDRHAAYFLDLGVCAERELRGSGDQPAWLGRLETEHDNLRAALAWLGDSDPAGALRLAGALSPFWAVRGHAAEGLERLEQVLDRPAPGADLHRAHALAGAGVLAWVRGQPERSRRLSAEALALYRELGDGPGMVRALANLGFAALQAGEHETATSLYEECLSVARADGHPRGVTIALNCLTELALAERDLARARRVGEEGLALSREIGEQESIGVALLNLGYVALHDDRLDGARDLLREAAEVFGALGDQEVVAYALNGLAATHTGDPGLAARLLGSAAALQESVGGAVSFEPGVREAAIQRVRAALGDEAFAAAYAEGQELELGRALALTRL